MTNGLLASAVVLGNIPAIGTVTVHATDGIVISTTNFPDSTFMDYVKTFDTDSNGELSAEEIDKVTDISVSSKGITDLNGIEHFTKLETLKCNKNKLTSLDVSGNTELISFECDNNSFLITADVSDSKYDLSKLPTGFDISKASGWTGGTVTDGVVVRVTDEAGAYKVLSPSTLGIDTKKLDNADAQREKEKTTLYTRNKVVEAL